MVELGAVIRPVHRAESPIPGRPYRQIGVRLWGEGAYERETIDGGATKYAELYRAEAGDVIVNKIWARNGSVGVVSNALAGAYASSEFPMFSPENERIDPRWIHWLTKTPTFWAQCDDKSRGTSGQNRIRPERFLEIEIPLPPLNEQRRLLDRIERLAALIDEAACLRKRSIAEASLLSQSCAEERLRELARGVGTYRLLDICLSITDGDHITPSFVETGVPFIFVGNVSSGFLHFENSRFVSNDYFESLRDTRVPRKGDILYGAVGATLGIPALVETDTPFCFQRHIAILKPDHGRVDSRFLWHMLRATSVFEKAWASTTGSAQPTIPLRSIRELSIPVPTLAEQWEIATDLDHQGVQIDTLLGLQGETAATLDLLLPAVLHRAFKGEL